MRDRTRGAEWTRRVATPLMVTPLVVAVLLTLAGGGVAQQVGDPNPTRLGVTRSSLQELATLYRGYASSTAYSDSLREQAQMELQRIERRLAEGDFGEGDMIALEVANEPLLTDTFAVASDGSITLPDVGSVSLRGVLRSELDDHLRISLARFLRDPQISASSLVRLAVLGEVNTPGFYVVPANTPLTDVLMTAGGPTATADVATLRVEREGRVVLRAGAADQGRSVEQLNLKPGDRIVLPAEPPPLPQRLQLLTMTLPLLALVATTLLQFQ